MASYRLQALQYASEVAFASNAANPSVNTWDQRVPAESIVMTLPQERIRDVAAQGRLAVAGLSHMGPRTGCSLEWTANFIGNQSDPASSTVTERFQTTLLGYALGGKRTAGSGSTISGTSSTVSQIYVASAAGWVPGDFAAIGAKGDGEGDGQVVAISATTDASGLLDLLVNAPTAPATAGAVVQRLACVYHDEDATLTTTRFIGMHANTGSQFHMMGGQLTGFTISTPMDGSGPSKITYRYGFAYWARQATTFPPSTTLQDNWGAAPAGGSVCLQDFGTKTRTTKTATMINLNVELEFQPIVGPGGNGEYQTIVGWAKTGYGATLSMQIPWETARETAFDVANASYTYEQALATFNPRGANGGGLITGYHARRMFYEGNRPSGVINVNGQCYVEAFWRLTESTDTTSDLTRASLVIFSG